MTYNRSFDIGSTSITIRTTATRHIELLIEDTDGLTAAKSLDESQAGHLYDNLAAALRHLYTPTPDPVMPPPPDGIEDGEDG